MNELPIGDKPLSVDTSDGRPAYLLTCADGRALKLSPSAYYLTQSVRAGESFATIAERLSRQGRPVAPGDVEVAYHHVAARIRGIESRTLTLPFGFWMSYSCIPAARVRRIARPLSV